MKETIAILGGRNTLQPEGGRLNAAPARRFALALSRERGSGEANGGDTSSEDVP
jgi:hypothetical protein